VKGETLKAINAKTYELEPDMLVIADAQRPVGLAGVMGGLDTEIRPTTRNVLIEAAQFDPMSVRRTARALGLFSPSSYRFERPLDPETTDWASRRCAELMLELAGGTLHPGVVDVQTPRPSRASVTLRLDQIERVLGITIDRSEVARILQALGLRIQAESATSLTVDPPSWRADLEREIDLVEEVARIHGYEHIPENRPVPLTRSKRGVRERVETEVRNTLTACGFDEAYTFSLVSEALIVDVDPSRPVKPIVVEHSSRKKENILRTSLVPSLLASRARNEAHGTPDASQFEIAHVYLPDPAGPLPNEPTRLGILGGGDFLNIKGIVETILDRLHITDPLKARPVASPLFVPGRAAELRLGEVTLGMVGEVATEVRERVGLRGACAAAELSFDLLMARATLVPQNRPLPAFPAVMRDLSLVIETAVPWEELASVASAAAGSALEEIEYLDVFSGGDIPPGKHSIHFAMQFRNPARTLTGGEVDRAVGLVIEACGVRLGATLRA
jgi:phenylalanyl-tRNA synthetase beta chain